MFAVAASLLATFSLVPPSAPAPPSPPNTCVDSSFEEEISISGREHGDQPSVPGKALRRPCKSSGGTRALATTFARQPIFCPSHSVPTQGSRQPT